jgi:hypothetical protein
MKSSPMLWIHESDAACFFGEEAAALKEYGSEARGRKKPSQNSTSGE